MRSLFGEEIPDTPKAGRKDNAHAALPGSGPRDQSCGTCGHYCRVHHHDKVWLKCGLMREHWTHGPGSDIRAKDKACRMWTMREEADDP